MLFCSHTESPAHLGYRKPAWGLWWHNLSGGLWVGGWMGLNPLCHAEITFVTGVPGCPIHRLVDCRLSECEMALALLHVYFENLCLRGWGEHLVLFLRAPLLGLICTSKSAWPPRLHQSVRTPNTVGYFYILLLLLSGSTKIMCHSYGLQSVGYSIKRESINICNHFAHWSLFENLLFFLNFITL